MLNEDRIAMMTKLAAYEQNKGKKSLKINKYFRGDYLLMQMLKTLLYVTFSFGLALGLYLLYHLEELTENLYKMDLIGFGMQILKVYGICLAAGLAVTYLVYTYRYAKAKKSLKGFMQNLKKLNAQQQ